MTGDSCSASPAYVSKWVTFAASALIQVCLVLSSVAAQQLLQTATPRQRGGGRCCWHSVKLGQCQAWLG